jgi:hypothetical protein
MFTVEELQHLDPGAWTYLLGEVMQMPDLIVTDVASEPCGLDRHVLRYVVTLYGYSDPICFIGKKTGAMEVRFYQEVAPMLPTLTAQCWRKRLNGDHSWLLLEEIYGDYTQEQWTVRDVESIIDQMATLHSVTRPHAAEWAEEGLFPYFVGALNNNFFPDVKSMPLLSEHALRHSGRLAPVLQQAAVGLERLRAIGGWPGVLDEQQMLAAADLIDDPLPMTLPLQQLPPSLIHGDMAPSRWRLSLFNEKRLLAWQHCAVGAGVYDLVAFIEQFGLVQDEAGRWLLRQQWPANEEMMVDSYLLHMSDRLGANFNARAVRQAIPAARCLYVMTTWLPRFAAWLSQSAGPMEPLTQIRPQSQRLHLAEAGLAQMVGLQSYLAGVFRRFLGAYKLL